MKKLLILSVLPLFVLICLVPLFAFELGARGPFDFPPGPKLIYPASDSVNLSGKEFLEFQWDTTDFIDANDYEFRLYKGYKTLEGNLIERKVFSSSVSSLKLSAAQFENGQVYTWVMRRTFSDGRKSEITSNSFVVTK